MRRVSTNALLTLLTLGSLPASHVLAADSSGSKAPDLPPMMSSGSVITPDMLKKQLGNDYLEMNGDDMFSEPDPLGAVKSPVPQTLKDADKKSDAKQPAANDDKSKAASTVASPAFSAKPAPNKKPTTALKPVESAPLSAPPVAAKDDGMPVAFPAEQKPPEPPPAPPADAATSPSAVTPPEAAKAETPPAPPALPSTLTPPAVANTQPPPPANDQPFYKKLWGKFFPSEEKKPVAAVAPAPATPAPENTAAPAPQPVPPSALVTPPSQPAPEVAEPPPVIPASAASDNAAEKPADKKPETPATVTASKPSKNIVPFTVPAEDLAVPPKESPKTEVSKSAAESGSTVKNLASHKIIPSLPVPAKKPEHEVEQPVIAAQPEPTAKPEQKAEQPATPTVEPVKAETQKPEALPAVPPEAPPAEAAAPVVEPEQPALPPGAPPKADYPLPTVSNDGKALPFADIQAATPVDKMPSEQPPKVAEHKEQAFAGPIPAVKPEAPKELLKKYNDGQEEASLRRKYANDPLVKHYKGGDSAYMPYPNRAPRKLSSIDVPSNEPHLMTGSNDSGYDNGLSSSTERMLRKFPKGVSSFKHEEGPTGPVKIDHGGSGFQFPKEGYSDDSQIGISVDKKQVDNSSALLDQAYAASQMDQNESAIELYKQVIAKHPEHKFALFGLATAYQKSNQIPQAREVYQRLLKIYPDYSDALNNFLVMVADESPSSALSELAKLEKRNPEFSPILAQMGLIYLRQGDYQNASNYLGRAMAISPENLSYRYNMAIVMDNMGQNDEAIKLYQQVLDAKKSNGGLPFKTDGIEERLTFLRSNPS